jgi:exodeoxyribonuclease V
MTSLTKEQRSVVRWLLKGLDRDQVQTLGGYAGTGKTTVVSALAAGLPRFAPCAFTGKAAHVMRGKGMPASTIHGLIYHAVPRPGGGVVFRRRQRYELGCSGFLVDEASMVGQDLYADLLSFGLPVIFVGDHGQLPPVGSDVNVMENPQHRLETIHRNAGEIAHFAEHLRNGHQPRSFHAGKRVRVVAPTEVTDELLLSPQQLICAYNRTRVGVNQRVRELLGRRRVLEKGDRIICLRNARQAGLFNGQQGVVRRVRVKSGLLDFTADDGAAYTDVPFDPSTFGQERPAINYAPDAPHPFDYAYCVTAHKAQGSEWDKVLVFEQHCPHWEHARWAYTAASRAKLSLAWVADERAPFVPAGGRPGKSAKNGTARRVRACRGPHTAWDC